MRGDATPRPNPEAARPLMAPVFPETIGAVGPAPSSGGVMPPFFADPSVVGKKAPAQPTAEPPVDESTAAEAATGDEPSAASGQAEPIAAEDLVQEPEGVEAVAAEYDSSATDIAMPEEPLADSAETRSSTEVEWSPEAEPWSEPAEAVAPADEDWGEPEEEWITAEDEWNAAQETWDAHTSSTRMAADEDTPATRLADRLEALAARLRGEGADALQPDSGSGDPLDRLLKALLSGYLAGRDE